MGDRAYISRYGSQVFGLQVYVGGVPGNADSGVTAVMTNEDVGGPPVFTRPCVNTAPGEYTVTLLSADTANPGNYALTFSYTVGGVADQWMVELLVGQAAPQYDVLPPEMKAIVENVWLRVADLIDYETGGPNLQAYVQANFGRNRIAQLLKIALGRINTGMQPVMTYTVDGVGGAEFPVATWGPLLETGCLIETIKHLMRSYVEQPEFQSGAGVSRLDRRDYMDRWQDILLVEQPMYRSQLETFKIQNMGFGRPRVLVSGGTYGRFGPQRYPLSAAARPVFWARFY
jgi:hypothetical protein